MSSEGTRAARVFGEGDRENGEDGRGVGLGYIIELILNVTQMVLVLS